jgi:hypothetical protein
VLSGNIYIPGGGIVQGYGATNIVEAFIPVTPPRRPAVRH